MASIFTLFGEVLIDNQKANQSIDETTKKAEKSSSRIGSAFSAIGKGALALGATVVSGASAIGTAAYSVATNTAEQADYIDKLSERTGINREELQRWKHAADQSGVSVDSFKNGIKKMSDVVDDANNGSKTAETAISRLGLSLDELNKMSTEEKFNAITAALADMEDGAERNALGNDLLGKSYTEMLPLLNAGSEGIAALKKEADDLGIVMSESSVKAGVKLGDTIANVKAAFGGIMNKIGTAAIPLIQKGADMILSALPQIQSTCAQAIPIITSVFDTVLPPLMQLAQALFPALLGVITSLLPLIQSAITSILPIIVLLIQQLTPFLVQIVDKILPIVAELLESLMPLLTEIIKSILPVIVELLELLLPPIIQIVEALLPVLTSLIEALMPILEPLMDALRSIIEAILPPLTEAIQFLTEKVMPPLQAIFKAVAEVVSTQFKNAFESIKKVFDNVKGIFQGIIDFIKNVFTGNWKGAWEAVVNIFSNIFEGIANAFKVPINWVIDGINGFIRGLNKIQIPDWVPLVGGKGFNIAELKRLRIGMEYVPYDDMPALLHKGERVLTASENKEYGEYERQRTSGEYSDRVPVIKIEFGEKSIYINHLDGRDEKDIDSFVDMIIELIYEKIKRKRVVFE